MKTAVIVCPGRGTYGKSELGSLARFPDKELLASFDAERARHGQELLTALDSASSYSIARHTRGDNASALIYACTIGDVMSLSDVEIVAVTGNSMGWYSALACAGAFSPMDGFTVVNTMGTLMQEALIGGQLVYPFMDENWSDSPDRRAELLALTAEIGARGGHQLWLSIELGGMLVLAGNEPGLSAFEAAVPRVQGRFPLRLGNHAAFHTQLQAPVAVKGRAALPEGLFGQPKTPLIDGRGHVWWPGAASCVSLRDYTLGHQVVETYDFTAAIRTAACEFGPDYFIIPGPGTTLYSAVAQSLIRTKWRGLSTKADFQRGQSNGMVIAPMR